MPGADRKRRSDDVLVGVLSRSQELGLLGGSDLGVHLRNGAAFVEALRSVEMPISRLLDLGSGGGVPGLVVASAREDLTIDLLDARHRRCDFLRLAVQELGWADRVQVVEGRAEELAHEPHLRGSQDVVTARAFGSPAVTAECAVGFLRGPGSVILISEPPEVDAATRWPAAGLEQLGLTLGGRTVGAGSTIQHLVLVSVPPEWAPRPSGRPSKRPLF